MAITIMQKKAMTTLEVQKVVLSEGAGVGGAGVIFEAEH